MTWSNSYPDFGGCSSPHSPAAASSAIDSKEKRPRRGGTWGRLTEPPTEGGWFLAGCSARSTPPSADNPIRSVKNRSRNLCRETDSFVCPAPASKKTARRRSLYGDRQMEKAAGSPCGLRVKIECV
jgi:hypothetical protein